MCQKFRLLLPFAVCVSWPSKGSTHFPLGRAKSYRFELFDLCGCCCCYCYLLALSMAMVLVSLLALVLPPH